MLGGEIQVGGFCRVVELTRGDTVTAGLPCLAYTDMQFVTNFTRT